MKKSKAVYEQHKRHFEPKECYTNIFATTAKYSSNFRSGKWKIAYGYMEVLDGLLCRHCFVLDENNKVIDPTAFTYNKNDRDKAYYSMYVFDNIDTYYEAVEQERYYASLYEYLRQYDAQAREWAAKKAWLLSG